MLSCQPGSNTATGGLAALCVRLPAWPVEGSELPTATSKARSRDGAAGCSRHFNTCPVLG